MAFAGIYMVLFLFDRNLLSGAFHPLEAHSNFADGYGILGGSLGLFGLLVLLAAALLRVTDWALLQAPSN